MFEVCSIFLQNSDLTFWVERILHLYLLIENILNLAFCLF